MHIVRRFYAYAYLCLYFRVFWFVVLLKFELLPYLKHTWEIYLSIYIYKSGERLGIIQFSDRKDGGGDDPEIETQRTLLYI